MVDLTARPAPPESTAEMEQVIERARADPAAFQPLYEKYFPRVYHYCLLRVSHRQEAEDLTSLIFTRALANLARYRGGSFAAWIFRIAHNAVVNYWRDRRVTVSLAAADLPVIRDDLSGRLIHAEDHQRLARLLAGLPEEQRELLDLKIAGDLSAREIGQVVGKSEGAVRVAIHRIVGQLRTAWFEEPIA